MNFLSWIFTKSSIESSSIKFISVFSKFASSKFKSYIIDPSKLALNYFSLFTKFFLIWCYSKIRFPKLFFSFNESCLSCLIGCMPPFAFSNFYYVVEIIFAFWLFFLICNLFFPRALRIFNSSSENIYFNSFYSYLISERLIYYILLIFSAWIAGSLNRFGRSWNC